MTSHNLYNWKSQFTNNLQVTTEWSFFRWTLPCMYCNAFSLLLHRLRICMLWDISFGFLKDLCDILNASAWNYIVLGRLLSDIEQLKDIQLSTSLRYSNKDLYLGNLEVRSSYSEGKTASIILFCCSKRSNARKHCVTVLYYDMCVVWCNWGIMSHYHVAH